MPGPIMELGLADVTWRTARWLKDCENECRDKELVWCPLVHPLNAWSDEATLGLTSHLLAAWKWTLAVYEVPTCPPTPIVLNIGQFLDEAQVGGGSWSEQQWLEAYAKALPRVGEAAEGRKWVPVDKNFIPRVSPLVEAFLEVLYVDVKEDHAMDCWGDNPEQVLQQKDECAHAKVISYLDELATHRPSRKSWDELVWPQQSAMPVSLHKRVSVGYL